jgi:putative molybdopterin biosynthesis protein
MLVMEKPYYTVEEVAKELQIHPVTVQRYIRSGELTAYKIGKIYRIHAEDLRRFMEGRRTDREKES